MNLKILTALLLFHVSCGSAPIHFKKAKPGILQRDWSFMGSDQKDNAKQLSNFSKAQINGKYLAYGSKHFGLTTIHKDSGKLLWRKKVSKGISSNIVIKKDKLFVGGNDTFFYALNLVDGTERWKTELKYPIIGTPLLVRNRIFVSTEDNALHALKVSNGKKLWTFRRNTAVNFGIKGGGNPSFFDKKVWVGFSDGSLLALRPKDGSVALEIFFKDNKFTDIDAKPIPWKNGLLITTYDGKFRYLRRNSRLIWEFPAGGSHSPLVSIKKETAFLPSSDGSLYAIALKRGNKIWQFRLPKGIPTGVELFFRKKRPILVVTSSHDYIYALDAKNGVLLDALSLGNSSGTYSGITKDPQYKEKFYIVSHFGRVHMFSLNLNKRPFL